MSKKSEPISHRIVYSGWDFQQALSALTFLLEECDFEKDYSKIDWRKFRCYETTVIVSFARPFKVGRGREELGLSEIGFKFTDKENELKKKLLNLRDKVISHSDEEEMEYRMYSLKPFDDNEVKMPAVYFHETLHINENECYEIEKLLHRLLDAIAHYKFDFIQSNPKGFEQFKAATSNQNQ